LLSLTISQIGKEKEGKKKGGERKGGVREGGHEGKTCVKVYLVKKSKGARERHISAGYDVFGTLQGI
jgi:hypothetical protein